MPFLQYVLLTSLFVLAVAYLMIRTLATRPLPPDSDDGGNPGDAALPIVDMPPGSTLSDWLTDRWPENVPSKVS